MNAKIKKIVSIILILVLGIILTTFLIIFGWKLSSSAILNKQPLVYANVYIVIVAVVILALSWLCIVKIKKGIILVIITIVVSVVTSYAIIRNHINNIYEDGVFYVDHYRYEDAISYFEKISYLDYKDNDDYINLCLAYKHYEDGRENIAYDELKELDFKYISKEQQKQIDELIVEVEAKINEEKKEEKTVPVIDSSDDVVATNDKPKPSYQKPDKEDEEEEDPYNAKDYATEEDFYDDHYDDFYEFEEAQDYYWEHQD